mgnify:FL=1
MRRYSQNASMRSRRSLREASATGNVDRLFGQLERSMMAIEKVQSSLMDAADILDEILIEAIAIGGKIAEIVPSHIQLHIAELTKIADQNLNPMIEGGQSSLKSLQDLIGSIPYRDIRPLSAEERRQSLTAAPDLSNGPQSHITGAQSQESSQESLEDYYKNVLTDEAKQVGKNDTELNFESIKESQVFGMKYEEDMMSSMNMKLAKPIDVKPIREKLRAAVEDEMLEDVNPLKESGPLDFSKLRAFGGSDGMPISFNTLTEGGHIV